MKELADKKLIVIINLLMPRWLSRDFHAFGLNTPRGTVAREQYPRIVTVQTS